MKKNKKTLAALTRSVLVGVVSAAMVMSSLGGSAIQAKAAERVDLKPTVFSFEDLVAEPGTTGKLNLTVNTETGLSAFMGDLNVEAPLTIGKVGRGVFGGSLSYSTSSSRLLYLSGDGCNIYGDDVIGKIQILVPEGTPGGKYDVTLDLDEVSYAYEDLSGQIDIPTDLYNTKVVGVVKVPVAYEPLTFTMEDAEAEAGTSVEVMVNAENITGFSGLLGTISAEGGLKVNDIYSEDLGGSYMYSSRTGMFIYLTSDGCNTYESGALGSLDVEVPEGTPAGTYAITMEIEQASYAYENLSGQELIPTDEYTTVVVGHVTVPETVVDPEPVEPEFDAIEFTMSSAEAEAGTSARLNIEITNPTGISGLLGTIEAEGGLVVDRMVKGDLGGSFGYSQNTGVFYYLTEDGCNIYGDGTIGKLRVQIPEGTPAGTYAVKLVLEQVSYAYEDLSGQVLIPADKYTNMVVGYVTVPETVVEPTPVEPTPVEPTPVEPTPVEPTPVEPTPVEPTPVEPTPVDPTPVDPTPVDPTPVEPASDVTVTYTVVNWGSEHQVIFKVTNNSDKAVETWNFKVNKNDVQIDSSWNVVITEDDGYYVMNPMDWNAMIQPGKSIEFGTQGKGIVKDVIEVVVNGAVNDNPVDPTPVDPTPVDPTPVDPTPVDPTPVDPTPVDPTPVDPTPVDPTPVDPTPVDPTPVDPTPVDPTDNVITISDLEFAKSIDLSAYDYKNIKQIVVKFNGDASQFSGAVVLGEWVQQESYDNSSVKNNTITIDVKSAQSVLAIYKWWSDKTLELDSVDLIF